MKDNEKVLRAGQHNWGMSCIGDWSATYWHVYADQTIRYEWRSSAYPGEKPTIKRRSFQLPSMDFNELINIVNSDLEKSMTHHNACDGTAWEIKTYSPDGDIKNSIPIGYIYGVPALERIAAILYSVVTEEE